MGVNIAKIIGIIAVIVCVVLGMTEYSLHQRFSTGLPLLVVLYSLLIIGCVYALRWNHRKNVEHKKRMSMKDQWSFRGRDDQ